MLPAIELDLRSIQLVLRVAEHRSLRRAAASLNISESALSHRLRNLEEALTVSLFHRSPIGVEPTHAGEAFFRDSREALRLLGMAASDAAAASRGEVGQVTFGLYAALVGRVRDAVGACKTSLPNVQFRIIEGGRPEIVEGLNIRNVDIAILAGPVDVKLGDALLLWPERLFVLLPIDHRLAKNQHIDWDMIRDEIFLVATRDAGPEVEAVLHQESRRAGWRPTIRSHTVSCQSISEMVALGFGISLLIESKLVRLPAEVLAVPLGGPEHWTQIQLSAYRDPSNDNPPLRRAWALMERKFGVKPAAL